MILFGNEAEEVIYRELNCRDLVHGLLSVWGYVQRGIKGMKKAKEKKDRKIPMLVKVAGFVFLALFVIFLAAFLLLYFYLGKINYQRSTTTDAMKENGQDTALFTDDQQEELEETDISQLDSSAEEIAALEQRLLEQTSGMEQLMFDEDVMNILLIGYDSRDAGSRGRSDTNILVSVNRKKQEITVTSIMRDSYVVIPGHGNNRINAAYAFGGGPLLVETIEKNLRIHVNHYVAVDFYAFMDIIDRIGGVELEVSDAEAEVMNRYIRELNRLQDCQEEEDQLDGGGILHLNGKQTLAYTRVRYVGNADFERTERQRTVLKKVFEKAKKLNLLELNDLLNCLLPEVSTDMSEKEVLFLLLKSPSFLQYELKSLRIPADGTYESLRINGMAVLGVDLEENRNLLEDEIYGDSER